MIRFAARAVREGYPAALEHGKAVEVDGGARMFCFMKRLAAESGRLACYGDAVLSEVARRRIGFFLQGQVAPRHQGGLAGAYGVRQPA